MALDSAAKAFMATPNFAVVGASSDPSKFGHKIFAWYLDHHLPVTPINPSSSRISANNKDYDAVKSLEDIKNPARTAVSIITPPKVTKAVLEAAKRLGVQSVWLQPGTYDDEVISMAKEFRNAVYGMEGSNAHDGWCVLVDGEMALEARGKL